MSSVTAVSLEASRSVEPYSVPSTLTGRLIGLALIFAVELVAISMWLDGPNLSRQTSLSWFVAVWGDWVLRGIVGFAAVFATFSWLRNRPALRAMSAELAGYPVSLRLLTTHVCLLGVFAVLSYFTYGHFLGGFALNLAFVVWMLAGCAAIALASLAFLPAAVWAQLVTSSGRLWIYSLATVTVACIAGFEFRDLWRPAASLTFRIVELILHPFLPSLSGDPANLILSTPAFGVRISQACSGFEGAGLIIAFGVLWLVLFRQECRFPHALALIPLGVAVLFLLNSVRIAALILIGSVGAQQIALGGFHSQAGWIAFNVVALGFCVAARRVPWFTRSGVIHKSIVDGCRNPVAPYVLPMVVLLAAGMLSRAMTGDFEWSYPVRLLAAVLVLYVFKKDYSGNRYGNLDWHFGWFGLTAGALVFAIWIGIDKLTGVSLQSMPSALAGSPARLRLYWELARGLSAVVTVPIIEELAFRGFLLRRLISRDFERTDFAAIPWFALLASSLVFGMLHGGRWIAGTIAGLVYGYVFLRRGRIGDAIVAHAVTNALIAATVLAFNQWQLW